MMKSQRGFRDATRQQGWLEDMFARP